MKKIDLRFFARILIIITFIFGILMCAYIYPFFTSLSTISFSEKKGIVMFYSQMTFYLVASIPIFIILVLFWILTKRSKNDSNNKIIKFLKIIALILLSDLIFYLIGNVIFIFLGVVFINYIYILIDLFGFSFLCFLIYIINLIKESNKKELLIKN